MEPKVKEQIALIENALSRLNWNDNPKSLYDPIEYVLSLGGKRIRPILMFATYRLFKEDYEKCLPFAIGMEMVHNASLIHDDMPCIDNDDFRHGILTNHKKFDHATALLAGDMLFNQGYITISEDLKNDKEFALKILKINLNAISDFLAKIIPVYCILSVSISQFNIFVGCL